MNNTFNLKRFILLFKKHTIEHAKTYLLSSLVLAGILFLILGLASYNRNGNLPIDVQANMFIYFMLISGCLFTSVVFSDLGDKKKAIPLLTLPASHLEKYLVSWIYSYIIFQLVFVGIYYFVDGSVISLGQPPVEHKYELINIFSMEQMAFIAFIIYGLLHAFTFWGAVFFEKLHFIKTSAIFFFCLIALIIINKPLISLLVKNGASADLPFTEVYFIDNTQLHHIWRFSPDNMILNYDIAALALIVILMWTSTFYKLKEKEV
jgi:hypothetical protein